MCLLPGPPFLPVQANCKVPSFNYMYNVFVHHTRRLPQPTKPTGTLKCRLERQKNINDGFPNILLQAQHAPKSIVTCKADTCVRSDSFSHIMHICTVYIQVHHMLRNLNIRFAALHMCKASVVLVSQDFQTVQTKVVVASKSTKVSIPALQCTKTHAMAGPSC